MKTNVMVTPNEFDINDEGLLGSVSPRQQRQHFVINEVACVTGGKRGTWILCSWGVFFPG